MRSSLVQSLGVLAALITSQRLQASGVEDFLNRPPQWYSTAEAQRIADTILTYQTPHGDFPKNIDTSSKPFDGDRHNLKGTFDNGATTSELRFLARVAAGNPASRYGAAFNLGLDHVLAAQYPNGGWPQSAPPPKDYPRHITFNDNSMVRLLRFIRDVATDDHAFAFVDATRRERANRAWEKGIDCILNCQIVVEGEPAGWCAQHDEVTLLPAKGRSYELPSLSGSEGAAIAMLLMEIDAPSERIKQAVRGTARWFHRNQITGVRLDRKPDATSPKGYDIVLVHDPDAPPLWARFYDLETSKPFYCGRDGIKKSDLADIEIERRVGYAWLRPTGAPLLAAYSTWALRHGLPTTLD